MRLRWTILVGLICCLAACAKPPREEFEAAEYLIERAYTQRAPELAPAEYQSAFVALEDARHAMTAGDYERARSASAYALQHARRALVVTDEVKARQATKAAAEARAAAERAAAEQARAQELARLAEERAQAARPAPPSKPAPPPTPAPTYKVGDGETLWTIAAQPVVYGDGLLWPLLYQANRDQIKDPRQIFPGQTLNIRRDLTPDDMESARQKARESNIFPVPGIPPQSPATSR